ncbi:MAG TPA: hypothetical protein PLU33_11250 [Treponemataceae bacterium]|nr:hypothetical protein [Treponemataceae bacterium]HQL05706.1 hypothetical protein [Treponemataceae bacterium]
MKKISFCLISLLCFALIFSSCDLFDGDVTEWEAKEVINKTREHLRDLYALNSQGYKAGAVIARVSTPPNGKEKTIISTVEYYDLVDYKISYKESVKFTNWSGDGSKPYMNMFGTITHECLEYEHKLNGTLKLTNSDNNVDNITMNIAIDSTGKITGTVKADAQEFTW